MSIIGSKRLIKALLQQGGTFYTELEGETNAYDFVDIRAKRSDIAIASNTTVVIDSVNATNGQCLGRMSEDVLGLIRELLTARRSVMLMQHLYISDARYPSYDLHREARLYTLHFVDTEEPTYVSIGPDYMVHTYPIYPLIA